MKKTFLLIASVALALCACNKVDHPEGGEKVAPLVYHLNIQASMDPQTKGVTFGTDGESITSQFKAGDKVYVYNKTQGALARHWDNGESSYLATPIVLSSDDIQNEGRSCTLKGDLAFYKLNDSDEWENVAVAAGDAYDLYYLMNEPDYSYANTNYYPRNDYSLQDGSADTASQCDFAEATGIEMDMAGSTLTVPGSVKFTNLQSMFRQKLTFKNSANETVTPTIKVLRIDTEQGTLISYHNPTYNIGDSPERYDTFSIDIDNPVISNGNIFLSLSFYYPDDDSKDDVFSLTALDTEGNVYKCAKNVPSGGFQPGKYYFGDSEMVWQYQYIKPTVTRSDDGDTDELTPFGGQYDIYSGTSGDINITISGSSSEYCFCLNDSPATATLTDNGTAVYSANNPFIYEVDTDDDGLTIVLGSDFTIVCSNHAAAIWSEFGNLKLKTMGSEQTLTVTANDTVYRGLYGSNNYDRGDESDVNALAAPGFTVTCSARTDNSDGTYTWVYTVTPTTP